MAIVEADISISVDGFVAGPNTDQYPGLGQDGEILHAWLGEPDAEKIISDTFASWGAVLTSRAIYEGTGGWGAEPPFRMPVFVVTHRPHEPEIRGETTFTFASDGITAAVAQAAATAGDKKVHIMGGASIIQQALNAKLVDQLHLHVTPVLLGDGTPLFAHLDGPIRLEQIEAAATRYAHHLRYRVMKYVQSPNQARQPAGTLADVTVSICAAVMTPLPAQTQQRRQFEQITEQPVERGIISDGGPQHASGVGALAQR